MPPNEMKRFSQITKLLPYLLSQHHFFPMETNLNPRERTSQKSSKFASYLHYNTSFWYVQHNLIVIFIDYQLFKVLITSCYNLLLISSYTMLHVNIVDNFLRYIFLADVWQIFCHVPWINKWVFFFTNNVGLIIWLNFQNSKIRLIT